jgi:hypothetical protein
MGPTLAPRRSRLARGTGKSANNSNPVNDFTGLLVLRSSRGKSAGFSRLVNDLRRLLVLRGPEQDSTEMAEEIGAGDPEFLLGEIPRQLGRWLTVLPFDIAIIPDIMVI